MPLLPHPPAKRDYPVLRTIPSPPLPPPRLLVIAAPCHLLSMLLVLACIFRLGRSLLSSQPSLLVAITYFTSSVGGGGGGGCCDGQAGTRECVLTSILLLSLLPVTKEERKAEAADK